MFRLKIVCVGKMREGWQRAACDEYLKRLSRFADVTVREVKEETFVDCPNRREKEEILRREGERILRELPAGVPAVALAIEGKETDSEGLAAMLTSLRDGAGEAAFVIGGSYGLADEVKSRARLLSFSPMTFPHALARVMLLEQLYRGFSIAAGSAYHK